jgi:hypothetical protein
VIIDCNCYWGHYPFRRLPNYQASGLIAMLDHNGIDQALVSSLHTVFYRNAHEGNRELMEDIEAHRDRLWPLATINPKYVGWQADLQEAAEVWQVKGINLWPNYHGYVLSDELGQAALAAIDELDLPVVLTQRLEDRRQRHHWDVAEDLTQQEVLDAVQAFPTLRIAFCNWTGLDGRKLLQAGLQGRCLIDLARLDLLVRGSIDGLLDSLGAESVSFGSHAPFDYFGPSLVKLSTLIELSKRGSVPQPSVDKVMFQNAQQFFRLTA